MARNLLSQLRAGLPREEPGRLEYTRRAFGMLPDLGEPCILDVGCGPGGPTLELARLSGGQVVGVDVLGSALHTLAKRIKQVGLSGRAHTVKASMCALGFRGQSFDIVWAEGSAFIIGFERGLRTWRRLIRPGGFLVVHEMVWLRPDPPAEIRRYWQGRFPQVQVIPAILEQIAVCGYERVGHFALPEDAWWTVYYGPLEARIQELRGGHAAEAAVLDREQREIEMFRKGQNWYGSAFFVMQKPGVVVPS